MEIEQGFFSLPLVDTRNRDRKKVYSNAQQILGWMKSLKSGQLREFRLQSARALRLMQLDDRHNFSSWSERFEADREFAEGVYQSVNERLANNFGIPRTEINSSLERQAEESNTSVRAPKDKMPPDVAGKFEIVNEVELADHPIDLLRIIFDPKFSQKARFEAVRKLSHIEEGTLVAENPTLREKRAEFKLFTKFLNEHVWMEGPIGEFGEVYFLSKHDPDNDFTCTSVEVREMTFEEADELSRQLPANHKLSLASRRRFQVQPGQPEAGRIVDIYISNRLKANGDQRVKVERKGNGENPENSNKDAIGARIVTNTKDEIDLFIQHLQVCADKAGSDVRIHDVQDSLDGEEFKGDNAGSSPDIQMIKFLVRIANIELEMQAYDSIGYANASFKRGPSHPEYWWNRLFRSGWFVKNFPPDLYKYDPDTLYKRLIRNERQKIEQTTTPNTTPSEEVRESEQISPIEPSSYLGKLLTTVSARVDSALERVRNRFSS